MLEQHRRALHRLLQRLLGGGAGAVGADLDAPAARAGDGLLDRPRGALVSSLDLQALAGQLGAGLADGATVSAVDPDGRVLLRAPRLPAPPASTAVETLRRRIASNEPFEARGRDGVERIYFGTLLPETGWYVVAGVPRAGLHGARVATTRSLAAAGALSFLLMLLASWRLGTLVSRPVAALHGGVRSVLDGRLDATVPVTGPPELRRMATDFNRMLRALRRDRSRSGALLDGLPEAVLATDATEVVLANQAAAALFGESPATMAGSALERWLPERFRAAGRALAADVLASPAAPGPPRVRA